MFARARQRGQCVVDADAGGRPGGLVRGVEGQGRRAAERRAHQHDRPEHVGPQQRTPGRHRRPEGMADDASHRPQPERRDQAQGITHEVEHAKAPDIAVEAPVPPGATAVAALVGCDDVVTGGRQHRHQLAPAVGEFGETVQQQDSRPFRGLVTGFQHVQREPVDAGHEAAAHPCRQGQGRQGLWKSGGHRPTVGLTGERRGRRPVSRGGRRHVPWRRHAPAFRRAGHASGGRGKREAGFGACGRRWNWTWVRPFEGCGTECPRLTSAWSVRQPTHGARRIQPPCNPDTP